MFKKLWPFVLLFAVWPSIAYATYWNVQQLHAVQNAPLAPLQPLPVITVAVEPETQTQPKIAIDDLKASSAGDPAKILTYLENVKSGDTIGSPLAPYAYLIAQSKFWSLILSICVPEQWDCTRAPDWNFWGMMMPGGGLRHFNSAPEAINFMDNYFTQLYSRRSTVQSLQGYYCASACTNWQELVLKTKRQLEM